VEKTTSKNALQTTIDALEMFLVLDKSRGRQASGFFLQLR